MKDYFGVDLRLYTLRNDDSRYDDDISYWLIMLLQS